MAVLFSSGAILCMYRDSEMMRSRREECLVSIEKSVLENKCECSRECSLMAENDGLARGRPVLVDLPLCSSMRSRNQREVDPTYLAWQLGQVNKYTTFETRSVLQLARCLRKFPIVLVLVKTKVNLI